MRGYHGSGFDGNNANRFMSLVDVLERDLTTARRSDILPIVDCLRKLSLVKSATFGSVLGTDVSNIVEEFKVSYAHLQVYARDLFDYELTVSWKIHIAVCHIIPFVKFNNNSLGNYAEQCGEAVHHKFKKTWTNYKRAIGHTNYSEKLKSAVVKFNSNNK